MQRHEREAVEAIWDALKGTDLVMETRGKQRKHPKIVVVLIGKGGFSASRSLSCSPKSRDACIQDARGWAARMVRDYRATNCTEVPISTVRKKPKR